MTDTIDKTQSNEGSALLEKIHLLAYKLSAVMMYEPLSVCHDALIMLLGGCRAEIEKEQGVTKGIVEEAS
jgi:hypothetical protein